MRTFILFSFWLSAVSFTLTALLIGIAGIKSADKLASALLTLPMMGWAAYLLWG